VCHACNLEIPGDWAGCGVHQALDDHAHVGLDAAHFPLRAQLLVDVHLHFLLVSVLKGAFNNMDRAIGYFHG
jgi:hypothetical protein